ncbi:MAG: hypothetical protein ACREQ9_14095, partial [Candidatus Binatia bacterium]
PTADFILKNSAIVVAAEAFSPSDSARLFEGPGGRNALGHFRAGVAYSVGLLRRCFRQLHYRARKRSARA